MITKTISEWEAENGCIVINLNPSDKLTEAQWNAIDISDKFGVNHTDRIKFLKDNGYEVTRDNMIDGSLSAKEAES